MILYLIRHGQSIANSLKIQNGDEKDVLSQLGIEQIIQLKQFIKDHNISPNKYYTTTWERARQSAQLLWPEMPWIIDPRIGETNAGTASTMHCDIFNKENADFYSSTSNKYPNGESHDDLNYRSINWLKEVAATSNEADKIAVVAHAGSITCILQHLIGMGMDKFPAFLVPNASLSIVQVPKNPGLNNLPRILGLSIRPNYSNEFNWIFHGTKWP
jgi:glucosyl-3-phosphoglycerate phosphatase